ncbi:MAG: L-aspartate oxidase [Planctomycetes bacterium]|nr:L-aspartate oxidase [Planctomycetota bacterium]
MQHPSETRLQRRLQGFDPRQVPVFRFDLVVVGGGAAGSAAALAAAKQGASVAMIVKRELRKTNTWWAKGGMATVLAPDDSFDLHVADTLAVGCGLCEEVVVQAIVRGGPEAVERLVALGGQYDRDADGKLDLTREGGHSRARIFHAGDSTGIVMQESLADAVEDHPGITVFPGHFVVDLLRDETGKVDGVLALRDTLKQQRFDASQPIPRVTFAAPNVLLATGGAGQLYRETTNPEIATGDGIALGFRAGAHVRDMEFFQFHPTCLYIAGAARVLISEIVRGAGGRLVDKNGEAFMQDAHPDADLAPRDVVSRACFSRMVATEDTSVYLDLSAVEGDAHALFPVVSRICGLFGIDIAKDPVPVRPGAHYMVGGLVVDGDGRTNVAGLFAAGECASSGLHGANRMGSNSLLEALVLGHRAGLAAAAAGGRVPNLSTSGPPLDRDEGTAIDVNLEDVTYSLKSLMWRQLGIEREAEAIEDALDKIGLWTRAVQDLTEPCARSYELLNMLTVARLVALGAIAREESRGVHYRTDFPNEDPAWRAHSLQVPRTSDGEILGVELERIPITPRPVAQNA